MAQRADQLYHVQSSLMKVQCLLHEVEQHWNQQPQLHHAVNTLNAKGPRCLEYAANELKAFLEGMVGD